MSLPDGGLLLSVDPGVRGCGCALFARGRLLRAGYAESERAKGSDMPEVAASALAAIKWVGGDLPAVVVLEFPQIYQRGGGRTLGDPNSLLPLAAIDGAIAVLFYDVDVRSVLPFTWKSNLDGDAKIEQVKELLDDRERALVALPRAKSLQHNVWDAVGIGMHALGRLKKKRVFHLA